MLGLTKTTYWKNVNPVGAMGELRDVFRDAGSNRWRIAFFAMLTTGTMFWALTHDTWRMKPPRPKIIYINSWPKTRTEAETKKFIAENQKWKEARAAEQARAEQESREMYKAIGRASGMDVDRIEADAKAEASASAAADEARFKQQAPVADK